MILASAATNTLILFLSFSLFLLWYLQVQPQTLLYCFCPFLCFYYDTCKCSHKHSYIVSVLFFVSTNYDTSTATNTLMLFLSFSLFLLWYLQVQPQTLLYCFCPFLCFYYDTCKCSHKHLYCFCPFLCFYYDTCKCSHKHSIIVSVLFFVSTNYDTSTATNTLILFLSFSLFLLWYLQVQSQTLLYCFCPFLCFYYDTCKCSHKHSYIVSVLFFVSTMILASAATNTLLLFLSFSLFLLTMIQVQPQTLLYCFCPFLCFYYDTCRCSHKHSYIVSVLFFVSTMVLASAATNTGIKRYMVVRLCSNCSMSDHKRSIKKLKKESLEKEGRLNKQKSINRCCVSLLLSLPSMDSVLGFLFLFLGIFWGFRAN